MQAPVVKAVVFDLGKVLLDFDYGIAARKIARRGNINPDDTRWFMDQLPLLLRYETGLLTNEEFFAQVRAVTGFQGDLAEFAECFGGIFTPIEPMVQLHAAVRQRGLPTYIFSNTNDLAIGHVRRSFPFFAGFDGYVFSYEHGAMKPDARLYEVLERQSGRRGAEIVYLDDRPENVAAGAARGWQALLHESSENTRAALRKFGLVNAG